MPTTRKRRRTLGEVPTRAQQETDELQLALIQGGLVLAGVGIIGGGSYYLVSRAIKKSQQTKTERKALSTGIDPGTFALQLHSAMNPSGFDSWISFDTTDVVSLLGVVRSVPTKSAWRDVAKQYEILYRRPLSRDIAEELDTAELAQAIALIKAKPEK